MRSNLAFRSDEEWERYPLFQPAGIGPKVAQYQQFELRTAGGRQITITGNAPNFPEDLERAVVEILALDGLENNWDSYDARPVELPAIKCAIKFVLETCFPICTVPRVAANRAGGVDLHWSDAEKELEVSVRPDERFEALLTLEEAEFETPEPVGYSQGAEFLRRYRSAQ